MEFSIRKEQESDQERIERLIDLSFGGAGRKKRTVYRYRDGISPLTELSFIATSSQDGLLGSIRFWPCKLANDTQIPLLGPLAVNPDMRGHGIGHALVKRGLQACKQADYPAVLIVGDPGYYAPFGFNTRCVEAIHLSDSVTPLTLMGLEFTPNHLSQHQGLVTPDR